jgi:hypothetical protein
VLCGAQCLTPTYQHIGNINRTPGEIGGILISRGLIINNKKILNYNWVRTIDDVIDFLG